MITDITPKQLAYVLSHMVNNLYAPTIKWVNEQVTEISSLNARYTGGDPYLGFAYRNKRYLVAANLRFPASLDQSLHTAMDQIWQVEQTLLVEEKAYATNLCNFAASTASSYWHLFQLLPEGLTRFLAEIQKADAERGDYVVDLPEEVVTAFQTKHAVGISMVKRRLTRNTLNNFT